MKVLVTDVETTGLSAENDRCIEVAAVLYDVDTACVVESFASLIHGTRNEAQDINRISPLALLFAPKAEDVWDRVSRLARKADAYAAHNAPFDRSFYPSDLATLLPWIDTKEDIVWPRGSAGDKLVVLALAHDLGVSHAHRAMVDCDLIARLFTRVHEMGHSLPNMLAKAMRPKALFEVADTRFNEERNKASRAAGFKWAPEVNAERSEWNSAKRLRHLDAAEQRRLDFLDADIDRLEAAEIVESLRAQVATLTTERDNALKAWELEHGVANAGDEHIATLTAERDALLLSWQTAMRQRDAATKDESLANLRAIRAERERDAATESALRRGEQITELLNKNEALTTRVTEAERLLSMSRREISRDEAPNLLNMIGAFLAEKT